MAKHYSHSNQNQVPQRESLTVQIPLPALGQRRVAGSREGVPTGAWLSRHASPRPRSGCSVTTHHNGVKRRPRKSSTAGEPISSQE